MKLTKANVVVAILVLALCVGVAPYANAGSVTTTQRIVNDTEPVGLTGVSDEPDPTSGDYASVWRQVKHTLPNIPYAGVSATLVRFVVVDPTTFGGVQLAPWTPIPFAPASACTEKAKCQEAADIVCRKFNKGGAKKDSANVTAGGDCNAKCADSAETPVFIVCLGGASVLY